MRRNEEYKILITFSVCYMICVRHLVHIDRSVHKVSSLVRRKVEKFVREDSRYKKHCTQDNEVSASFKVGTLKPHISLSISPTVKNTLQNPLLESPSAALSYFPESHPQSEIPSLSKVILVLGKARSHRVSNMGCRGSESPGCFTKKFCMRRDA